MSVKCKFKFIALVCGLLLVNCTNLDEVEDRIDRIENEVTDMQTAPEPKLLGMEFLAEHNPYALITDATCTIIGDSVVDCWVHNIMEDKQLIAHFSFEGDKVTIGDEELLSDVTRYDFKHPVKLVVKAGDKTQEYTVYVHTFTGLPVLWIETEGRKDITSKDVYQRASFKLTEDVVTRAAGDVIEDSVSIKGRGNSTWSMPKKPYRLKLDKKLPLLGDPKDKSWVLLNNYADKTMLCNATAFYMGKLAILNIRHVTISLN